MIDTAVGNYPGGHMFTTPWTHWVVDDFLTRDNYLKLIDLAKTKKFYTVDGSDGHIVISPTDPKSIATKYCLTIEDDSIEHNVKSSIKKVIDSTYIDNLFTSIDLIICDPGYFYPKHCDHKEKLLSVIVYLTPHRGNGTVLLDSNDKKYNLTWKRNRALILQQNKSFYHYYKNDTKVSRLTLNIYFTKDNDGVFTTGINYK